ncbi:hypothetical protein PK35_02445 [Tamlana nanhaiensis]|uniref:TonB-dependent receptor n=1 Tax=Neotamlana nanhaiensis TaxID=1382798 RepID=A0A0D7WA82_9FLAO|nr:hypothetical protein [Tamlana nanhaiensis]KJD34652.1 hypothetical protein PK35_02445 [Tamlana nanhaiensis]
MKTNLYIFLVLLLSVSFASAQNTSEVTTIETVTVVSVENDNDTIATEVNTEKETLLIDAAELKQTIARGASDIRKYLTRERKAGNITVVFPKSNKAVKA